MKHSPFGNLPWDMVVFLSITTAGLGVSFKRLAYPEKFSSADVHVVDREPDSLAPNSRFTLDLGCLDRKVGNERITFDERRIRFKGKFCNLTRRQMHSFEGVRVRNLSTGYEGTVFFQGSDTLFVSDMIQLQAGKNVIEIEWRENKHSPQQILVTEVFEK